MTAAGPVPTSSLPNSLDHPIIGRIDYDVAAPSIESHVINRLISLFSHGSSNRGVDRQCGLIQLPSTTRCKGWGWPEQYASDASIHRDPTAVSSGQFPRHHRFSAAIRGSCGVA